MHLLVIIPCLNEAATIGGVIERIPRAIPGICKTDIVVIDDGSSDDTAAIAKGLGAQVIRHRHNRGVGAALQSGVLYARQLGVDIAVSIDGDGQFSPEDIPRLIEPLLSGRADFATASRFLDPSLMPQMPAIKVFGNRAIARLVSFLTGQHLADASCGFRAYSRQALEALNLNGVFTYTHESLLQLAFKNMQIVEVPLAVRGVREFGESRVAANLFRYGLQVSRIIFSCYRDYRPGTVFYFLSATFALLATLFALFFFIHRLVAGAFEPHIWAGFLAGFLFGVASFLFLFGQIAVMIFRLRETLESELRLMRRSNLASADPMLPPSPMSLPRSPALTPTAPAARGQD